MKTLALLAVSPWLVAQTPPQTPAAAARGPMLLPQAIVMPRGDREIAIDGTLSDWPELPALRLDDQRQLSGTATNAWNGPRDLSAVAFLMWDKQNLFVAAAVKDEWHRGLDAGTLQLSEVPVADSVVLTFDPDRNTRANGPDPGRIEDREFWLADEAARTVVNWDRLRGTAKQLAANAARVVVLHDKEHGVTSYEARIPWTEILPRGREVAVGTVIDLQIVVNDFDESTDPMPQTRMGWTFGCNSVIDPGLLGSLMLVGDREALKGVVPEFPPKPGVVEPPARPEQYWNDLTARLLQLPPAVHDGAQAPEEAGGLRRMAILEEIDGHCERFPRVDCIEFYQRIHRRMSREVAGLHARGLPWWWSTRLKSVSKNAEDPVPNGSLRLFRLPMGGWLVATPAAGFGVDMTGADLSEWMWGRTEFCLLTQPLDMTRRNDQMLLRMLLNKPPRAVLTHITFHLPVVSMGDLPLVDMGTKFGPPAGVQIHALGEKKKDGSVTASCSYVLTVPNGPRVMFLAPALRPEDFREQDFADPAVDVAIISPHCPGLLSIVQAVRPRLVVIEDAFLCQSHPSIPRVSLRDLYQLQKALQPQRSIVLAPGESWDIERAR